MAHTRSKIVVGPLPKGMQQSKLSLKECGLLRNTDFLRVTQLVPVYAHAVLVWLCNISCTQSGCSLLVCGHIRETTTQKVYKG